MSVLSVVRYSVIITLFRMCCYDKLLLDQIVVSVVRCMFNLKSCSHKPVTSSSNQLCVSETLRLIVL